MNIENVVKGLEEVQHYIEVENLPAHTLKAKLVIDDALALLKAQKPRVMTFSEVKKHYNLPPVFVDDLDAQEDYYQDIQPLYFDFPNPAPWDVHWRNSDKVRTYLDKWEDRYNKTWRCWTSCPNQVTREAVKWDD